MKTIAEKVIEVVTLNCDICGRIIPNDSRQINTCQICGREHCNKCQTSSHISKLRNHQDKNTLIGVCPICENINNEYILKMDKERECSRSILSEIRLQWKNESKQINSQFESLIKDTLLRSE